MLAEWASKDGQAAVEALLQSNRQVFVQQNFPLTMEAWVNSDPKSADAWYLSGNRAELRNHAVASRWEKNLRIVFLNGRCWQNPVRGICGIDLLGSPEEIYGAVQGARDAATIIGWPPEKLVADLNALTLNGAPAISAENLQNALKDAEIHFGRSQQSKSLLSDKIGKYGFR